MGIEDNLSRDDYILLIYALCAKQQTEMEKMLANLEKELRVSNRFFPNTEIAQTIQSLASLSSYIIERGTILYRCRLIGKEDEAKYLERFNGPYLSLIRHFLPTFDENNGEEWVKFIFYFERHPDEYAEFQNMCQQLRKQQSQPAFWGYDAVNSDAPPVGLPASGRINPDGISYLYAAGDVKTAILEVRPVPTQYVSVAQIEILNDITMYSFSKPSEIDDEGKNILTWTDYGAISGYFTRPHYGGNAYYLATQYISEYIKHMKDNKGHVLFDGLCFQSSLNPDGTNYVLFDVSHKKKYRICNSSLYQVEDLLGNSKRILPFPPNQD